MFGKDIAIALAIYMVLIFGLLFVFDYRLPFLAALLLYAVVYAVVASIMARLGRNKDVEEQGEVPEELPTSGPIGRFGQTGLIFSFTVTGLFSLLNPFQLTQMILQMIGNLWLQIRGGQNKQDELPANKVKYRLPFSGEWYIYNGGVTQEKSHSWGVLTQRFAYDFVQVDAQMRRHSGNGTDLNDYFCFGEEIVAAADGTVVKVVDRVRSAPFVGYGIVDFLATSFIGNHVIIKHAEGEFGLYAHLIKGTIPVQVGDEVKQGQAIGQCGHSGHSSEPHLHFHLQDRRNFYFAMGLPIAFNHLLVNREEVETRYVEAGDVVQNF
ncbi:MAG: peptidoglycan DD-metalloendopeptidase family protein [Chloroflexota bacterium]